MFLFVDIICIFGDDFPNLQSVASFLIGCANARSVVGLLPKVIVISSKTSGSLGDAGQIQQFYRELHEMGPTRVTGSFRNRPTPHRQLA